MTAPLIALLDNDPAFLAQMHALLTAAGYRTLRCRPRDVRSAHALVTRCQPALVILDRWWRGRGDGWEFLTDLWADPATMRIGVVLACPQVIASSLQRDILRAMRCRMVRNPLDRDDVLRAIAAVLGPSPMQRERASQRGVLPSAERAVPDRLDAPLVAAGEDVRRIFLPPFSPCGGGSPYHRTRSPFFTHGIRRSQRCDCRGRCVPSRAVRMPRCAQPRAGRKRAAEPL